MSNEFNEPSEGQINVAFNGDEWIFHNGEWQLGTCYNSFSLLAEDLED